MLTFRMVGMQQVREKQLLTRVQYEVNDQAENEQLAQKERDATELSVQTINLNVRPSSWLGCSVPHGGLEHSLNLEIGMGCPY